MPLKGYKQTDKHKISNLGRKHPNRKPYFKGLKYISKICLFCGNEFITNSRNPKKKYCSKTCSNSNHPEINLRNLSKVDRNYQKQVASSIKGELHPNWKGGNSKGYKDGYYSKEYKKWRISIFERDGYKCQCCGIVGVYITAHHIKSFAHYPKLRYEINNGITLCEPCHSLTDNYKGRNKGKSLN